MRIAISLFSMTLFGLLASQATAGTVCDVPGACCPTQIHGSPDCCGHCGCGCCCKKYCKIVCEMKKVKKVVWEVKCSEFCTLLPGCGRDCCCGKCGPQCCEDHACCEGCCKKCDPCAVENQRAATMKTPKCGKIRTKKQLIKKEIICEVPTYKCVVVYCCPTCGVREECCQPEKSVAAASATKDSGSLPNPPMPPAPALPTR